MLEPLDLDRLSFDFFREFSRCEYCLKAVGFRRPGDTAEPDWGAFAGAVQQCFETPPNDEFARAVQYYLDSPPKKQIVRDGLLAWEDVVPQHESRADLLIQLLRRVRNNLFHGGKFNGHFFAPQRSGELLRHGLVILKGVVNAHPQVQDAYTNRLER